MTDTSIIDVYRPAISEWQIDYEVDATNQVEVLETVEALNLGITPILANHGYDSHNLLRASKDEYVAISREIKSSDTWRQNTLALLRLLGIDLTLEQAVEGVILPTWNESLASIKHTYDCRGLHISAKTIHSYVSSLLRKGLVKEYDLNPAGIVGLVHNQRNMTIGFRGGQIQKGNKNPLPAGSINPIDGKDIVFSTFYRELEEELNMKRSDIEELRLVGSTQDHAYTHISLFVFDALTNLTDKEIYARWKSGEDRFEHSDLGFFPYAESADFQDFLESSMPGTEGGLMQLGAVSLLAIGSSRFGREWFDNLPENLRTFCQFMPENEKRKLFI